MFLTYFITALWNADSSDKHCDSVNRGGHPVQSRIACAKIPPHENGDDEARWQGNCRCEECYADVAMRIFGWLHSYPLFLTVSLNPPPCSHALQTCWLSVTRCSQARSHKLFYPYLNTSHTLSLRIPASEHTALPASALDPQVASTSSCRIYSATGL